MAVTDNSDRLGCGRDLDEVWARADSPPDTHELTCPECQQARAGYAELSTLTHELRSRDESDPTLRLGLDVLTKVTSIARAEVRRGQQIPLQRQAPGSREPDLTITELAIATVIRGLGDATHGVEIRRCRIHEILDEAEEPAPAGIAGDAAAARAVPIRVTLTVSVSPQVPLAAQIAVLREQIMSAVATEVGLEARTVDVHVEDVHDV